MTSNNGLHRAVFDSVGEGLVVQVSDGRIIASNAAAERILGLTRDQMEGRTSTDPRWVAVHPDGSPFPGESHPAMVCLRTRQPVHEVVMGVHRPDDSYAWILINSEPLPMAGETAAITSFTDITSQMDEAAHKLRATVDSMLDPHVLLRAVRDADGNLLDVQVAEANAAAVAALSHTRERVVGSVLAEVLSQEARDLVYGWVTDAFEEGKPLALDQQRLDDSWVDIRAVRVGEYLSFTWRDVTERIEAAERTAESERLFRTAMKSAVTGMAINDLDGNFQVVNEALCRILRRSELELTHIALHDIADPEFLTDIAHERLRLLADPDRSSRLTGELIRGDGSRVWVTVGTAVIRNADQEPTAFLTQVEDVSGEREARQELAYQAFHDPLTGLRNRSWILDMLAVELNVASMRHGAVGVLFIDLDNFKVVNDSLGHAAGDEILQEVGHRIRAALGERDHAARFGGDEFVAVVTDVNSAQDVERVADRLASAIAQEITVSNHSVIPTASIGIAMSTDASTADSLLRNADVALFSAKDAGRARWHFFDDAMHAAAMARMSLETALRQGLENDEFSVFYQPVVRLSDCQVEGYEALVRWEHPERGLISAGEFIPVAEASGLIVPLGEKVVEAVVAQLRADPDLPGPISINISAMQLVSPRWRESFLAAIEGIDPSRLVVEVTETAMLAVVETIVDDLTHLRELGVGIHIDDFGTGFSSISLLRDLPVTGLKLDLSYVRALTAGDSSANALARGLAGLAEGLHLMSVAEGVEREDQRQILLAQGWTHGQGYLFGRPAPMAKPR